MMGIGETCLFYVVIGTGIAAACWFQNESQPLGRRLFGFVSAMAFWPIYLPILLTPQNEDEPKLERPQPAGSKTGQPDEFTRRIAEIRQELNAVTASLNEWTGQSLIPEGNRFGELLASWDAQANRIRQMDDVLNGLSIQSPECSEQEEGERTYRFEQSRRENLIRLNQVRANAKADLAASLAKVRELISLIHLARFSGPTDCRSDELIQEIAARIEGISEVANWSASETASISPAPSCSC